MTPTIGSHVCKALAEAGAQPICLDTLEKGHEWAVRWGELARGDVGDGRLVEEIFQRHKPQVASIWRATSRSANRSSIPNAIW